MNVSSYASSGNEVEITTLAEGTRYHKLSRKLVAIEEYQERSADIAFIKALGVVKSKCRFGEWKVIDTFFEEVDAGVNIYFDPILSRQSERKLFRIDVRMKAVCIYN